MADQYFRNQRATASHHRLVVLRSSRSSLLVLLGFKVPTIRFGLYLSNQLTTLSRERLVLPCFRFLVFFLIGLYALGYR